MKKLALLMVIATLSVLVACSKSKDSIPDMPRTDVPAEIRGNWMYGNFSMNEYWDMYPSDYIGNGAEFAFAFTFNADGTYVQYFTGSVVTGGVQEYHQSVSHGTLEVDPNTKVIITHALNAHYRKTIGRQVVEDRDLTQDELSETSKYTYSTGVAPSGTDALYLKLNDDENALPFLRMP